MKIVAMFALFLALAFPAFAQDDPNAINFCTGSLSYRLPEGWVAETVTHKNYGAMAVRIANSQAVLTSNVSLQDHQAKGSIIAFLRGTTTEPILMNKDTDLATILARFVDQLSKPFAASEITPVVIGDQSAVRVEVYTHVEDILIFAVNINTEAVGVVSVSAPSGQIDQWEAATLALVGSLTFEAPSLALANEASRPSESYATRDCTFSFVYPDGWTLIEDSANGAQSNAKWIANFADVEIPLSTALHSGQVVLRLNAIKGNPTIEDETELATYADYMSQQPGLEIVDKQELTIGGIPAIALQIGTKPDAPASIGDLLYIIMLFKNDVGTTIRVYTAHSEIEQWRDIALAIAASIEVNPPTT